MASITTKLGHYAMIFFMDGVGLGGDDPKVNPFLTANVPNFRRLAGAETFTYHTETYIGPSNSFVPTDAGVGVDGLPQSATGQAMILCGRNVSAAIGEHYGPKPNQAVRDELAKGTLFDQVAEAGGKAALLTPYPEGYFQAVNSGRRLYSSVPQAVVNAGLSLYGVDELRAGKAISPDFTNEGWVTMLGYDDLPQYSYQSAGETLAQIASTYQFSFFEHWLSDRFGHRGSLEDAVAHLEKIDQVVGALFDAWPQKDGLLIITSDHGNIEDKSRRNHTANPVPTILIGEGHATYAPMIRDLTDIAKVIAMHLGI
ncbi:MAG: hypothetical protein AAF633_12035 [Chloroflexota bacterium]